MIEFIKKHKILKNIILILLIVFLRVLLIIKKIFKLLKKSTSKVLYVFLFIIISFILINLIYNSYYNKALKYNLEIRETYLLKGPLDLYLIGKDVHVKEQEIEEEKEIIISILDTVGISCEKDQTIKYYEDTLIENVDLISSFYNNLENLLDKYLDKDHVVKSSLDKLKDIDKDNVILKLNQINEVNEDMKKYMNKNILSEILNNIVNGYDVSYYYEDPSTKEEFKDSEKEYFVAASTIKVGVATMIIDMVNEGKLNLDDLEYYNKVDQEAGTGIIQKDPIYTQYSIKYLLEVMIKYSDNIATNILIRTANDINGDDYYKNYMNNITENNFKINGNQINAYGAMKLVQNLYDNKDKKRYYTDIIKNMTETEFKDRMSLYIEDDIVAHKIGSNEHYFNDIGIVLLDNPFLFSSYCSEGQDICNNKIGDLTLSFYYYNIYKKDMD